MAVDEMEIDSNPTSHSVQEPEKERKRKHKNKDVSSSSPSKKKRKHDANNLIADETSTREKKSKKSSKKESNSSSKSKKSSKSKSAAASTPDSPYTLTTATLYLPLSPISISPTHALASLMAEHLSPLILTYYAPLKGVVLAYSNPTISSTDPAESSRSAFDPNPEPLTLAKTAGEYGVLYVYLTATFLVFRPQRGQILEGWVNVQSEGFLGAVALNLFSVGIERKRLPSDWKWIAPGEYEEGQDDKANGDDTTTKTESQNDDNDDNNSSSSEPSTTFDPEKEHFKPITLASDTNPLLDTDATAAESDESAAAQGYFQSVSGHRVRGTVRFRVVDIDVIPGAERDRGFMSIEGTMLTPEEEAQVVEDERNGVVSSFAGTPRRSSSLPIRTDPKTTTAMSGAIPESSSTAAEVEVEAEAEAEEPEQASPVKKNSSKENKEKKSKSSKSKKKEKEKK